MEEMKGSCQACAACLRCMHADTEEYLHRLAGKIASVKMSAEASKAAARAITEARAKVGGGDCERGNLGEGRGLGMRFEKG